MLMAILAAINLALQEAPTVISIIKGKNGGVTVTVYLDEADAQFDANLKQIADWQALHGKTPASV